MLQVYLIKASQERNRTSPGCDLCVFARQHTLPLLRKVTFRFLLGSSPRSL